MDGVVGLVEKVSVGSTRLEWEWEWLEAEEVASLAYQIPNAINK
jgi:hypothetical protein